MKEQSRKSKNRSSKKSGPFRTGRRNVRTQYGALCYRIKNQKLEILLVTSRERRRWIIPKGWPMKNLSPAETAAQEAWEEAGVRGKVSSMCAGIYTYRKRMPGDDLPCAVAVFPLKVKSREKQFPERGERKRKWFSRRKAAKKVTEHELSALIKSFDPRLVH